MGASGYGYLPFFHGLQQSGLYLGRRPVDLVGQHDVGEDRPPMRSEVLRAGVVDLGADDVGRQQVRRELDAAEIAIKVFGQRLDGARFGQPRQALAGPGRPLAGLGRSWQASIRHQWASGRPWVSGHIKAKTNKRDPGGGNRPRPNRVGSGHLLPHNSSLLKASRALPESFHTNFSRRIQPWA